MRFLSGLIVGFLLAIVVAYVHDSALPPSASADALVNWETFGKEAAALNVWVHEQIARLSGQIRRDG